MNQDPTSYYAKAGEPIRPKLKALAEFVASAMGLSIAGPGRLHQYANGRTVVLDPQVESFSGAFTVQMSGNLQVQVGMGTVNQVVPKIGKVRIDGLDDKGKKVNTGIPKLRVKEPGENLRSYVALRVELDEEKGEMDPENEKALQIVHLKALDPGTIAGGYPDDGEGVGYHPIVELEWADEQRLTRFRRILYFNQNHIYLPGKDERKGRHLFTPTT